MSDGVSIASRGYLTNPALCGIYTILSLSEIPFPSPSPSPSPEPVPEPEFVKFSGGGYYRPIDREEIEKDVIDDYNYYSIRFKYKDTEYSKIIVQKKGVSITINDLTIEEVNQMPTIRLKNITKI